jgi:hypothetical protein
MESWWAPMMVRGAEKVRTLGSKRAMTEDWRKGCVKTSRERKASMGSVWAAKAARTAGSGSMRGGAGGAVPRTFWVASVRLPVAAVANSSRGSFQMAMAFGFRAYGWR